MIRLIATSGLALAVATIAQGQTDCADWNTGRFFETATASNIWRYLGAGADIEALDETGRTPLHGAASFGTNETVIALLDAGADITARDKTTNCLGITPKKTTNSRARTLTGA